MYQHNAAPHTDATSDRVVVGSYLLSRTFAVYRDAASTKNLTPGAVDGIGAPFEHAAKLCLTNALEAVSDANGSSELWQRLIPAVIACFDAVADCDLASGMLGRCQPLLVRLMWALDAVAAREVDAGAMRTATLATDQSRVSGTSIVRIDSRHPIGALGFEHTWPVIKAPGGAATFEIRFDPRTTLRDITDWIKVRYVTDLRRGSVPAML